MNSGEHADRPNCSKTGAFGESFPQHNCTKDQGVCSGHGGREHHDNAVVFLAIGGLLIQFSGSASIVDLRESLNEGEKEMN
jgi:hypothetical protein